MNDQIDALKALQMALARLGYYTGAIDGLFGPRTDAALKAVAAEGGAFRNLKPPAATVAAGPMIFQGSARYRVEEIVIHCAATAPDWMRGQPLTAKRKEAERADKLAALKWLTPVMTQDGEGAILSVGVHLASVAIKEGGDVLWYHIDDITMLP